MLSCSDCRFWDKLKRRKEVIGKETFYYRTCLIKGEVMSTSQACEDIQKPNTIWCAHNSHWLNTEACIMRNSGRSKYSECPAHCNKGREMITTFYFKRGN